MWRHDAGPDWHDLARLWARIVWKALAAWPLWGTAAALWWLR